MGGDQERGDASLLMRRHPAGVVAPWSLLVPVVGMGLAALVLGERPSVVELVAAAVIIGGVLLGTPRTVHARLARTDEALRATA